MTYEAKPLPFNRQLVGISEKAIQIHHDKLYTGYINKRNEIEQKLKSADRSTANATYSEYGELKREESFAANGVVLHEYYFSVLGGHGQPSGALMAELEKHFGSYDKWLEDFKASGMVSRGWVVLAYDFNTGKLHNYLCDAHNHGGIWGAMPIIVMDMYEHAYFIDCGSDRKKYIEDYVKNLDWEKADKLFESIKK
ncbi:Fe-Mn family superoxide dismutase [Patescibacteria group bacterium]|nr:Fe-Mn family superoxide dismutase [Patescibacteria group bacterium]MBU1703181.1 Fe-Mn family superoxide dismutase [Patescibacteria group bacterium]